MQPYGSKLLLLFALGAVGSVAHAENQYTHRWVSYFSKLSGKAIIACGIDISIQSDDLALQKGKTGEVDGSVVYFDDDGAFRARINLELVDFSETKPRVYEVGNVSLAAGDVHIDPVQEDCADGSTYEFCGSIDSTSASTLYEFEKKGMVLMFDGKETKQSYRFFVSIEPDPLDEPDLAAAGAATHDACVAALQNKTHQ